MMQHFFKHYISLILGFLLSTQSFMAQARLCVDTTIDEAATCTVCVDPQGINDGSCNTVVKSIADVNALTSIELPSGSLIKLRRGKVWREQLTVPASKLHFTSYCILCDGSEPPPLLAADFNLMNKLDGGFEKFASGETLFHVETGSSLNIISTDTDTPYGNYALRLERHTNSAQPYVRMNIGNIKSGTSYYLGIASKYLDGSTEGLRFRLHRKESESGQPAQELQPNGSWQTTARYLTTGSSGGNVWQSNGFSFKTEENITEPLTIRFDISANQLDTKVLIDNLYLVEVPEDLFVTRNYNGDFETFTGIADDGINDDFSSWHEGGVINGNSVQAVIDGSNAIKMHREGTAPDLFIRRGMQYIDLDTEYNLALQTKIAAGSTGSVEVLIKDEYNGQYLRNDGSWGALEFLNAFQTSRYDDWEFRSLNFKTLASQPDNSTSTRLRLDFFLRSGDSTVFIDNARLSKARLTNSSISGVDQKHSILIDGKNNITVNEIDVMGTLENNHFSDYRIASDKLINIVNGANNITIKELSVSLASNIGIWSGHSTTDVTFSHLNVFGNQNTGIYMNSTGGSVAHSKVYNNGKNYLNLDRGGIGIQGGDISILSNEVWNNGPDSGMADFEISVAGATNQIRIEKNYVHDCIQGCIQVANDINMPANTGHLIAYNVISGFATSTLDFLDIGNNQETKKASAGSFSGIRIGAAGLSRDSTGCLIQDRTENVQVINNVITNGSSPIGNTGSFDDKQGSAIYISRFDTSGLNIINNTILDNERESIYSQHASFNTPAGCSGFGSDHSDYYFSHNLYASDATFSWKGITGISLSDWQLITTDDVLSMDVNSAELSAFMNSSDVFIDPAGAIVTDEYRYAPQINSPAIDSGLNFPAGILIDDYSGKLIDGSRDKGAFEF